MNSGPMSNGPVNSGPMSSGLMSSGSMGNWWCEHAWLPSGRIADRVLVSAADGVIDAIQVGVDPPTGAERLRGLVIPGLANTHSHAFHRALRGRTHQGSGDFWSWRDAMYRVAQRLDPDTYLALATAVYTEMALAGITCVGEFHYLHHDADGRRYADPNVMGHALMQAAAAAGIRLTLLDTCYLTGGFDQPLEGVQRRFSDGDAASWANRFESLTDSERVRIGAAIHSVRAVPAEQIPGVVKLAAEKPLHMHVSEQPAENNGCIAKYGRTPTQLLADTGALGSLSVAVHATHLTDGDAALLAATKTGVCLCPTTERDLADGIGPARDLAHRGVAVSLGSDSHAVIDLFEEARAVELDERLASRKRGCFSASALLQAATVNGHRALGWADAGELAIGMRADLVAVDLTSVRTAGCGTTIDTVVFAAAAADVTDVVVDGEYVVRDRAHVRIPDAAGAAQKSVAAVLP